MSGSMLKVVSSACLQSACGMGRAAETQAHNVAAAPTTYVY